MEEKISHLKELSIDELNVLSSEIREFLLEKISKNGGHLASNLGIVELTIALSYVFDFKKDKVIFDVGHQSYVYKMLTGRINNFDKLRKLHGLRGFPSIFESSYDYFDTGHSSTSISAGIGYARSRDLKHEKYQVISVIGDASIANGMAMEAINDLGYRKTKMIIILNDNGMSINQNVGGLSSYFSRLSLNKKYVHFKDDVKKTFRGHRIYNFLRWVKDGIRNFLVPNEYFEELGLTYVGVIDGHNIKELIKVLNKAKNINRPILIHIKTKKGLGYEKALKNPSLYHAVSPFDLAKGVIPSNKITYSSVVGNELLKLALKDKKIVAITGAMTDGVGLTNFSKEFPNRFFDVGIAEEHATTFAAGLAINGMKPYLFLYSTFMQRGFDQLLHDVCMMNLPVKIMLDRSGVVGADGQTHQGVFDLSYLTLIPNMTVLSPKCQKDIPKMLNFINHYEYPIALRYPRGTDELELSDIKEITLGKWEIIKNSSSNVCIIATGKMVQQALIMQNKYNLDLMIINACFIKPIDSNLLLELFKSSKKIITLEDNIKKGGLGSSILEYLHETNYHNDIKVMGFPDQFINQGTVNELYLEYHLDVDSIYNEILNINKK